MIDFKFLTWKNDLFLNDVQKNFPVIFFALNSLLLIPFFFHRKLILNLHNKTLIFNSLASLLRHKF